MYSVLHTKFSFPFESFPPPPSSPTIPSHNNTRKYKVHYNIFIYIQNVQKV